MTIIAAGAIVYRAGRGFLLLRNRDYWEFPKGRADDGDADLLATALREVGEETGLTDVTLIDGFREEEHYTVTRGPKMVTYFLARTKQEPTLSKEHRGYCWCTAREVEEFIRYEAKRVVFRKALAFLKKTDYFNAKDMGVKRRRKPRTKSSSQKNGSAAKK